MRDSESQISVSFSAIFQHKLKNSAHFLSSPVPPPRLYFDSLPYPAARATVSSMGTLTV